MDINYQFCWVLDNLKFSYRHIIWETIDFEMPDKNKESDLVNQENMDPSQFMHCRIREEKKV